MPPTLDAELQQQAAEAKVERLQRADGPFVIAAENTRMPMVFTDAQGSANRIIFANDSFLRLTGFERGEVIGRSLLSLIVCDQDLATRARLESCFLADDSSDSSFHFKRKDGSAFHSSVFLSPIQERDGTTTQHFASFLDTTSLMREKRHLQLLLDELNHRTQNTLVTVLAIASQTLRRLSDQVAYKNFEGRVMALSSTHELLGQGHWSGARLRDVADRILQAFGSGDSAASRICITGPEVSLPPKTALSLSLVFHELATNAAKYGALSEGSDGRVLLEWTLRLGSPANRLHLCWQESGGPRVALVAQRGFGMRLIEGGLAEELDGEVKLVFTASGARCEIDMPVPSEEGFLARA
jgi:PAS domain S-box-containing protein